LSDTVPMKVSPETTVAKLKDSMVTTGGITVSPPPAFAPLGNVAVTVTGVFAATGSASAVKLPVLMPPRMVKLAGTVTAVELELVKVTTSVAGAGGASPFKVTVPVDGVPGAALPVTVLGANMNELMIAGSTVREPFGMLLPSVAVTVTKTGPATPWLAVAVKVVDVFPDGIVTLEGNVTPEGAALLKKTVVPPEGAAWLRVTVPVEVELAGEVPPPVTEAGLKPNDITDIAGPTVTLAVA